MTWLDDLLWTQVLTIAGTPVSLVELIGFVTGVWCVWLVGRQNPWNWPIGLVQVVAYLFLFWEAGLYGDSLLQVVYLVLGLWGWWNWVRGRPQDAGLVVRRTRRVEWIALAGVGIVGGVALYWWLVAFTSSTVPAVDSVTTSLSLLATYGQARKLLESWWLWIVADLLYIPLYLSKGLNLTAVLYAVFLGLCLVGLRRWRADMRVGAAGVEVVAV